MKLHDNSEHMFMQTQHSSQEAFCFFRRHFLIQEKPTHSQKKPYNFCATNVHLGTFQRLASLCNTYCMSFQLRVRHIQPIILAENQADNGGSLWREAFFLTPFILKCDRNVPPNTDWRYQEQTRLSAVTLWVMPTHFLLSHPLSIIVQSLVGSVTMR